MMHEVKEIFNKALKHQENGIKNVLATVVHLDGSSYRKPGVRMLLGSNGDITGALSGGCIEKEVWHRSQSVFETGESKVITYDGRYRLGCRGVLYILLEPFDMSETLYQTFNEALAKRQGIKLLSTFQKEDERTGKFATFLDTDNGLLGFSKNAPPLLNADFEVFSQCVRPCTKLLIIGAEHDALQLCNMAAQLGWQVEVVSSHKNPKSKLDFPNAYKVLSIPPEMLPIEEIDKDTAVVLMTHNYALDLKYLRSLANIPCAYLGVLGATNRKEQLQNDLIEYDQEIENFDFYGPAGLDIGAETPQEIALSILSEVLAVMRKGLRSISVQPLSEQEWQTV